MRDQLIAAPELKANNNWQTKGTDEHGFSDYLGGRHFHNGSFHIMGESAYWGCDYDDIGYTG